MIDRTKLQDIQQRPDGSYTARCPACAGNGGDEKGEHLIVYADESFGCVANQGDKEHRSAIMKLVGEKSKGPRIIPRIDVAPLTPKASERILLVGRLGQKKPTAPGNVSPEQSPAPVSTPPPRPIPTPERACNACPEDEPQRQPWNEPGRDKMEAAREFLNYKQ